MLYLRVILEYCTRVVLKAIHAVSETVPPVEGVPVPLVVLAPHLLVGGSPRPDKPEVVEGEGEEGKDHHACEDGANPDWEVDLDQAPVCVGVASQDGDYTGGYREHSVERGLQEEKGEIFMVSLSHAGPNPRAVMIMHFNTGIAP